MPLDDSSLIYKTQSGPHEGKVPSSLYTVCVHSCPGAGETIVDKTACSNVTGSNQGHSRAIAESVGSHRCFDQKWAFRGSEWD